MSASPKAAKWPISKSASSTRYVIKRLTVSYDTHITGQIFDIRRGSASHYFQTLGVSPLANEFCL